MCCMLFRRMQDEMASGEEDEDMNKSDLLNVDE